MNEFDIPRSEFPRPDFERKNWICLNGKWEFQFDYKKEIRSIEQALIKNFEDEILVPFCYQSQLSGIGKTEDCETIWYKRDFQLNENQVMDQSVLLKFGAVDYESFVWVNGEFVGTHKGGYTPFEFDITDVAVSGKNTLVVRVIDTLNSDKPRGKQSWTGEKFGCWYTATTGIWQPVWIEFAGKEYIKAIKITTDIDALAAECEIYTSTSVEQVITLDATFNFNGRPITLGKIEAISRNGYARGIFTFKDYDHVAQQNLYWTPHSPNLIDVKVTLINEGKNDEVSTYFGMRKISTNGDNIMLNNMPYFQRLVLDQGYWEDSLITPPSDEAIIRDIKLTKELGFNGARKHQKIEDPRYYYWADKLGLLVWGELPSAYEFNSSAVISLQKEMAEFIIRDYNHPSIVTWVPLNESWGVRNIQVNKQQQDFAKSLYYMIKSLDQTRLISSNDGWEQINENDICALHDYALFADNLDKYNNLDQVMTHGVQGRLAYANGNSYQGQPILMTEYGGIAFSNTGQDEWGYFGKVKDEQEFLDRLEPVTDLFIKSHVFSGFCYTQLTDVMQEVNGLLDINRNPKLPIEKLREIFAKEWFK